MLTSYIHFIHATFKEKVTKSYRKRKHQSTSHDTTLQRKKRPLYEYSIDNLPSCFPSSVPTHIVFEKTQIVHSILFTYIFLLYVQFVHM